MYYIYIITIIIIRYYYLNLNVVLMEFAINFYGILINLIFTYLT